MDCFIKENYQKQQSICSFTIKDNQNRFIIKGVVGEGSFAEVYEAYDNLLQKQVILKRIHKDLHMSKQKALELYVEKYVLQTYAKQHPGIIEYFGNIQDDEYLFLILEYCPYGNFEPMISFINQNYKQSLEILIRGYIFQILLILKFLHSNKIAHLDIKPQNLVIDSNRNLKLIDFATCQFQDNEWPDKLKKYVEQSTLRPFQNIQSQKSFVGTTQYVSPEMLQNSEASYEADLWALGCIIYEIYNGKQPFDAPSENQIFQNISTLSFQNQSINENIPLDALELISKLLVIDPKQRLGSSNEMDLINHPFFNDVRNNQQWTEYMQLPAEVENFLYNSIMIPRYTLTEIYPFQAQFQNNSYLCMINSSQQSSQFSSRQGSIQSGILDSDKIPDHQQPIQKQKFSDATTGLKLSIESIVAEKQEKKNLQYSLVLMKSGWFCMCKPYMLMADMINNRLIVNDFRRQKIYIINQKVSVRRIQEQYLIERSDQDPFRIQFTVKDFSIDWIYVINQMKKKI